MNAGHPTRRSAYKLPHVYDLAFSYRDFDGEIAQMLHWYRRYSSRWMPRRAIEFASGPARHAIGIAHRGVATSAVDYSAEMCRYAQKRAAEQQIPLTVAQADMVHYRPDRRFDLALTMLDSIAHLHTESQLTTHFRSAAAGLSRHGIYILEAAGTQRGQVLNAWTVSDRSESVQVNWRARACRRMARARFENTVVRFRWTTREGSRNFEQHFKRRRWHRSEIVDCAHATGKLRVVGEFGGFDDRLRPDARRAARYILVLQRL